MTGPAAASRSSSFLGKLEAALDFGLLASSLNVGALALGFLTKYAAYLLLCSFTLSILAY